jgi:hypothetical protein
MKKSLQIATLVSIGLLGANVALANDAVVGAVLGGGAGALIGNSVNGHNGAVVGAALGAAAGAAIAANGPYYGTSAQVYYGPPQPVYYARPAYYGAPVYYPAPVYYARPVVAPVYYVGGHGHGDWHRHDNGHHDHH